MSSCSVLTFCRFFGAFSDPILEGFYTSFSNWELKIVLEALAEVQIVPSTSQNPPPSLSKAPPAIFYHLLSNLHVTQDPRILDILHHSVPAEHVTGWPTDAPPVGLLLLSMVQDKGVRGWAQRQLAMIKNTPMSPDRFLPAYASVLESATRAVSTSVSESSGGEGNNGPCSSFPFAQEHKLLWKGYCTALRHVPKAWLLPSALIAVDIRQTVMSHLSDAGPRKYFCFVRSP